MAESNLENTNIWNNLQLTNEKRARRLFCCNTSQSETWIPGQARYDKRVCHPDPNLSPRT
jgi:hypothetical protein